MGTRAHQPHLTVLFLAMRAVMEIGGTCGSIVGPDETIRPCPGEVVGLLPGAIWGGLIFTGLYVLVAAKYKVPSLVSLVWPALFLSLGYNFFDYGIHGQSGFVVCGVQGFDRHPYYGDRYGVYGTTPRTTEGVAH